MVHGCANLFFCVVTNLNVIVISHELINTAFYVGPRNEVTQNKFTIQECLAVRLAGYDGMEEIFHSSAESARRKWNT